MSQEVSPLEYPPYPPIVSDLWPTLPSSSIQIRNTLLLGLARSVGTMDSLQVEGDNLGLVGECLISLTWSHSPFALDFSTVLTQPIIFPFWIDEKYLITFQASSWLNPCLDLDSLRKWIPVILAWILIFFGHPTTSTKTSLLVDLDSPPIRFPP